MPEEMFYTHCIKIVHLILIYVYVTLWNLKITIVANINGQ